MGVIVENLDYGIQGFHRWLRDVHRKIRDGRARGLTTDMPIADEARSGQLFHFLQQYYFSQKPTGYELFRVTDEAGGRKMAARTKKPGVEIASQ
jgi:hypothetical protein